MHYKEKVDEDIAGILLEADPDDIEGYNVLYEKVKKKNRGLSHSTFYSHITRLLDQRLIRKVDSGRPRAKVRYFITSKGKNQIRLQILGGGTKQQLLRKVFTALIFHGMFRPRAFKIDDLDAFFSRLKANKRDLRLEEIDRDADHYSKEDMPELLSTTVYYMPIDGVTILKIIRYAINGHDIEGAEYLYIPPGISVEEFLEGKFYHGQLGRDEIENALQLLCNVKLLRRTVFDEKIRYLLRDELLRRFIVDLHRLVEAEQYLLRHTWSYLEEPTAEEQERAYLYYGKEMAEGIFRQCHLSFVEHYNSTRIAAKKLRIGADTKIVLTTQSRELEERQKQFLRGVSLMVEKYSDNILRKDEYDLIKEVAGKTCPFLLTALQLSKEEK